MKDVLTEALDLEGLELVIRDITDGRITCLEADDSTLETFDYTDSLPPVRIDGYGTDGSCASLSGLALGFGLLGPAWRRASWTMPGVKTTGSTMGASCLPAG